MTNSSSHHLILASRSPRRRALLTEAGYEFDTVFADDEAEDGCDVSGFSPIELVQKLAQAKAANVAEKIIAGKTNSTVVGNWIVLAADTVAEFEDRVLGKPVDRKDARRMLSLLSGTIHDVHTGVCLCNHEKIVVDVSTTRLKMDNLSDEDIVTYLETNKWMGKAAAFGYQDGWDWLHVIEGEESNVVGLPLQLLESMLQMFNQ